MDLLYMCMRFCWVPTSRGISGPSGTHVINFDEPRKQRWSRFAPGGRRESRSCPDLFQRSQPFTF